MNIKSYTPFVKDIINKDGQKTIKKLDKETKNLVAELVVNKDGSYIYKRHTIADGKPVTYRTEFDGKNRSEYLVQKARNGKLQTILTRQLLKIDSFIEWCDMFFDNKGEVIKEVIKVKGVKIPKVQTEIPKKHSQKVKN